MEKRIFRFGLTGILFILFCLLWYWVLGGSLEFIYEEPYNKISVGVGTILSSPGIGFILSSIFRAIWMIFLPNNMYIPPKKKNPIANEYYSLIKEKFDSDPGFIETNGFYKIQGNALFQNHEVLFRDATIHSEAVQYVERRYDVIWASINTVSAIILSLIIGCTTAADAEDLPNAGEYQYTKAAFITVVLIYIIISAARIKTLLKEVNDFEQRYILFVQKKAVKKQCTT